MATYCPFSRIELCISNFENIIAKIDTTQWKKTLNKVIKTHNVKVYNLEKLTINRVKQLYYVIVDKFYKEERNKEVWHQNQLRVFVWILFSYSSYAKKTPEEFVQQDWLLISGVFLSKPMDFCQFQYHNLKKLGDKLNKWAAQEDELLADILMRNYNQSDDYTLRARWNDVAKVFYLQSGKKYFRTPKQCRERWNNYLDPTKTKQQWSRAEDLQLLRLVVSRGKKWALISKQLLDGRRTEHMVKNRYNSLIVKYIKLHPFQSSDSLNYEKFKCWVSERKQNKSKYRQSIKIQDSLNPVLDQMKIQQLNQIQLKAQNQDNFNLKEEYQTQFLKNQKGLKEQIVVKLEFLPQSYDPQNSVIFEHLINSPTDQLQNKQQVYDQQNIIKGNMKSFAFESLIKYNPS